MENQWNDVDVNDNISNFVESLPFEEEVCK